MEKIVKACYKPYIYELILSLLLLFKIHTIFNYFVYSVFLFFFIYIVLH